MTPDSFATLLQEAVNEPGMISSAYSQFWNYSFGNQLLAWAQCMQRGLTVGPLATYPRWKALGRQVRRGERALTLCMPVIVKRQSDDVDGDAEVFTRFVYRNNWFVLAQTEGADVPPLTIPDWDSGTALATLGVQEIPFEALNGNCLGYARERPIAINPLNPLPHKTRFHELAHVLLGHTAEGGQQDGDDTPRDVREVEAEAVALLCCAALGLPASSTRADTSSPGGVRATRSRNVPPNGCSR